MKQPLFLSDQPHLRAEAIQELSNFHAPRSATVKKASFGQLFRREEILAIDHLGEITACKIRFQPLRTRSENDCFCGKRLPVYINLARPAQLPLTCDQRDFALAEDRLHALLHESDQ